MDAVLTISSQLTQLFHIWVKIQAGDCVAMTLKMTLQRRVLLKMRKNKPFVMGSTISIHYGDIIAVKDIPPNTPNEHLKEWAVVYYVLATVHPLARHQEIHRSSAHDQ